MKPKYYGASIPGYKAQSLAYSISKRKSTHRNRLCYTDRHHSTPPRGSCGNPIFSHFGYACISGSNRDFDEVLLLNLLTLLLSLLGEGEGRKGKSLCISNFIPNHICMKPLSELTEVSFYPSAHYSTVQCCPSCGLQVHVHCTAIQCAVLPDVIQRKNIPIERSGTTASLSYPSELAVFLCHNGHAATNHLYYLVVVNQPPLLLGHTLDVGMPPDRISRCFP